MKKKIIIFIIVFIILLFGIVVLLVVRGKPSLNNSNNTGSGSLSIPNFNQIGKLTSEQIAELKVFAANVVEAYNTYGYEELGGFQYLDSYYSDSLRDKTNSRVTELKSQLQPGQKVTTTMDQESFRLQIPAALDGIYIDMNGEVVETDGSASDHYPIHARLKLIIGPGGWLVDDIEIKKK